MSDNTQTVPYGISPSKEAWVPLPSGNFLSFASGQANPNGTDYIRIVDPDGGEIAYWCCDEWAEDPQFVMGAICGAMLSLPYKEDPKFYRFADDVNFPDGTEMEDE